MRIGFNLAIFEDHNKWDSLFSKSGKTPWPNKAWEIEGHSFGWGNLFDFELSWDRECDHAGVGLKLGLFGYVVEGKLYDSRHWDYDTGTWRVYDQAYMDRHFASEVTYETPALTQAEKATMVEEFLESDQGQRLIKKRVDEKLEQQKQSKLDKAARGEAYRQANAAKISDDESHANAKSNGF